MTELERIKLTCEVMKRQFPIGTTPDWLDCTLANELVYYWDARRRELEAAETASEPPEPTEPLAGEPPHGLLARVVALEAATVLVQHRAGCLEHDVQCLAKAQPQQDPTLERLAVLERRFEDHRAKILEMLHKHRHTPNEGGECYYP